MPNPWFILLFVLMLVGAFAGGEHIGNVRGTDAQKVADQKQFDTIEAERTTQKAEANALYRKAQDANLALMTERDQLKTTLGEQDAKNRKATLVLSASLATLKLQFRSAQSAGDRADGGSAKSSAANPACAESAAVVQLPDKVASDLRRLTFDADALADDYRLCYGYATKVR